MQKSKDIIYGIYWKSGFQYIWIYHTFGFTHFSQSIIIKYVKFIIRNIK
jgi:hypothetical protein